MSVFCRPRLPLPAPTSLFPFILELSIKSPSVSEKVLDCSSEVARIFSFHLWWLFMVERLFFIFLLMHISCLVCFDIFECNF